MSGSGDAWNSTRKTTEVSLSLNQTRRAKSASLRLRPLEIVSVGTSTAVSRSRCSCHSTARKSRISDSIAAPWAKRPL